MKRTVVVLTGLLALVAAAYVGGRLRAQTGAAPAPEPRTRIALINLLFVLEKYERGSALNT